MTDDRVHSKVNRRASCRLSTCAVARVRAAEWPWRLARHDHCDKENEDDESYLVCDRGYLSLFPFLLGLLSPDSPHLGAILDLLRDPEHLWSPYGLRSLSASHPEFGQGENYWKGPIWVQMNYLALRSLHTVRRSHYPLIAAMLTVFKIYAAEPGPHQARAKEIYAELRKNVVDNVHKVRLLHCLGV